MSKEWPDIPALLAEARDWAGRYVSWGDNGLVDRLADALEAATREPDAREQLHAKCDCVPDLGPAHCHLCSAGGQPMPWPECEAVTSAVPDTTTQLAQSLAMATTLTGSDATAIAKAALELGGTIRNETTAAVGRVRSLHQPMVIDGEQVCEHCFGEGYEEYVSWPCYTIALLDGKE